MPKCPICKREVEKFFIAHSTSQEPYTAVSVMEGLQAFGAIQAVKDTLCWEKPYQHIRFADGEERLIRIDPFDQAALAEKHNYHQDHPQACNEPGCSAQGMACYLDWIHEEPEDWYCPEHAPKNGYCAGCGQFSAGFESFDFAPAGMAGLCDACQELVRAEIEGEEALEAGDDEDYFDYEDAPWNN